jgi:1-acyl-sn-glycerol-3-phosphate acyltransferase
MRRYFTEPYRFVPPYRSTRWAKVFGLLLPRHLRRRFGISRWHFQGTEHLLDSLQQSAGVILAANHCRWADPPVLGMLGRSIGRYFYYLMSYHLLKQGRFSRWFLNRAGGFSIWREGVDREGLRAAAQVVADAERPLVLFPEGTWFRQNDRLGPIQEGISLIARQAARQTERPVLIHPVAIKYWALKDPRPALSRLLQAREAHFGWAPQDHLDHVQRAEKLTEAIVTLKEIEHCGRPGTGDIDARIRTFVEARLAVLEKNYFSRELDGWYMERIRRLRQLLARRLIETATDRAATAELECALNQLLLCENLSAHSSAYLREWPSFERLTETVQRIEEIVSDQWDLLVGPVGAVVSVGPALDARELTSELGPRRNDLLIQEVSASIQQGLDGLLAQGPPPVWKCPSPPSFGSARRGHPAEARAIPAVAASLNPAVPALKRPH